MILRRLAFVTLLAVPLAACGSADAPADDASTGAAPASAPANGSASSGTGSISAEEIRSHRLSMDELERWVAAQEDYLAAVESDPALLEQELERRRRLDEEDEANTPEQLLASLEQFAPLRDVVGRHGFTPREFVVVTLAAVSASLAAAAPNGALDAESNPNNLELFRANSAGTQQISARMQAVNDRFDELEDEHADPDEGDF